MHITKYRIIFVIPNKKDMELTDKEKDLIEMIRNFRSARPNGAKEFEYYIRQLLDELMYED